MRARYEAAWFGITTIIALITYTALGVTVKISYNDIMLALETIVTVIYVLKSGKLWQGFSIWNAIVISNDIQEFYIAKISSILLFSCIIYQIKFPTVYVMFTRIMVHVLIAKVFNTTSTM